MALTRVDPHRAQQGDPGAGLVSRSGAACSFPGRMGSRGFWAQATFEEKSPPYRLDTLVAIE